MFQSFGQLKRHGLNFNRNTILYESRIVFQQAIQPQGSFHNSHSKVSLTNLFNNCKVGEEVLILNYFFQSDVWALGCCVYEMATLKHAFNAKDMNSLVYKILRGKVNPVQLISERQRKVVSIFMDYKCSSCIEMCILLPFMYYI